MYFMLTIKDLKLSFLWAINKQRNIDSKIHNTLIHLDSLRLIPDTSDLAAFFQKHIGEAFPSTEHKTISLSCPAPMRSFSLSDGYSERIIYRQTEDRFPHDTYSPPIHRNRRNRNGCQEPVSSYGQRKTEFLNLVLHSPTWHIW